MRGYSFHSMRKLTTVGATKRDRRAIQTQSNVTERALAEARRLSRSHQPGSDNQNFKDLSLTRGHQLPASRHMTSE